MAEAESKSNTMSLSEIKSSKYLLNPLKIYTVVVPLILVGLIQIGLNGVLAVHLISLGCIFAFAVFLSAATIQISGEPRKKQISNYVFALIALLWIFVFEILLPSLARAK